MVGVLSTVIILVVLTILCRDALLLCQNSDQKDLNPALTTEDKIRSIVERESHEAPEKYEDVSYCEQPMESRVISPSLPVTPDRDSYAELRRTPSPSIRNLSNLSMVKQRLAQMNLSDFTSGSASPDMSSSRLTSPPFSPSSRATASTHEHRGWARRPITLHDPSPSRQSTMVDAEDTEDTRSIVELHRNKTLATGISESPESPFTIHISFARSIGHYLAVLTFRVQWHL